MTITATALFFLLHYLHHVWLFAASFTSRGETTCVSGAMKEEEKTKNVTSLCLRAVAVTSVFTVVPLPRAFISFTSQD